MEMLRELGCIVTPNTIFLERRISVPSRGHRTPVIYGSSIAVFSHQFDAGHTTAKAFPTGDRLGQFVVGGRKPRLWRSPSSSLSRGAVSRGCGSLLCRIRRSHCGMCSLPSPTSIGHSHSTYFPAGTRVAIASTHRR